MGPQHAAERLARVQADADPDRWVEATLGVPAINEPDDLPSTQDGAPGIVRPRLRNAEDQESAVSHELVDYPSMHPGCLHDSAAERRDDDGHPGRVHVLGQGG